MLLKPEKNKVLSADSGFRVKWEYPYEYKDKTKNGFYEVWINGEFVAKTACINGEEVWCRYKKPGLVNIVVKIRQFDNLLAEPIGITLLTRSRYIASLLL